MKNKLKYGTLALLIIVGIIGIIAFSYYQKIYGKAIVKNGNIYITSTNTIGDVENKIAAFISNPSDFSFVAGLKKFTKPKAGMYLLKEGMNMNNLVNMLRIGDQTAIKISFNNQDSLEKLAGRIAQQIETDSTSLLNAMRETSFLNANNFSQKTALGMYIANQYEVYWNTSPENFRKKMLAEYNRFWNTTRIAKAKKLNLTKEQVITLASIVQKETAKEDERPIVAGLYLNRYKDGWPLQADPTIIYALKEKHGHTTIFKRVLNKDLTIDSKYNTYKNVGLPPSLIAMPDISAIDAVLNPNKHPYYYMCASIDKIGFHEFAKTLAQHNRNAQKYQKWINQQGIKR